jgi:hypothetical protein
MALLSGEDAHAGIASAAMARTVVDQVRDRMRNLR